MGYAALTIVLYFLMAPLTVIGFIDKAIEVALIALLLDEPTWHAPNLQRAPGARTTGS
jgi:hypothetical protein